MVYGLKGKGPSNLRSPVSNFEELFLHVLRATVTEAFTHALMDTRYIQVMCLSVTCLACVAKSLSGFELNP